MPAKEAKKASVYRLRWDLEELVLEESFPDGQFVERARPGIGVPATPLAVTHPDLKALLIESLKKLRHGWLGQNHVLDIALSPPWAFAWLFEALDLPESDFVEFVEWELQQRVKSDLNDNIYAWQPVKEKVYAVVVRPDLLAFWDEILRSLSINVGKITLRAGLVSEQIESGADLLSLYRVWRQQQGLETAAPPAVAVEEPAFDEEFAAPSDPFGDDQLFEEDSSLLGDSTEFGGSTESESLFEEPGDSLLSDSGESLYGSGDEADLYDFSKPEEDSSSDLLDDSSFESDLGIGQSATDELLGDPLESLKTQRTDSFEDKDVSGFYDDIESNGNARKRSYDDDDELSDLYDEDDELGDYFKKKKPSPVLYVVIAAVLAFNIFLFRDKLPIPGLGGDENGEEEVAPPVLTVPTSTGFVAQLIDVADQTGNTVPGLILHGQKLRTEVHGDCTSVISFATNLMSKPGSSDWVINAPVAGSEVHLVDLKIANEGERELTASEFTAYIDSLGYQMLDDNIVRVDKAGLTDLLTHMESDSTRPFRLSVHDDGAGGYNIFMMP